MIELHHGSPHMVDHTPAADVAAGDAVVLGDAQCVAHRDIKANELGAVAWPGGQATYRITLAAAETFAIGAIVSIDGSGNAAAIGTAFGRAVLAADQGAGDTHVVAVHEKQ